MKAAWAEVHLVQAAAVTLFDLLDYDNNRFVSKEELVSGCRT